MKMILGKKLGMTRVFDADGNAVVVTLVEAKPNVVTQVKTLDIDGVEKVQIALPDDKKINQSQTGHLAKAGIKSRTIKEFPASGENEVGQKLDVSQFQINDRVCATGISKGKGFAGTIKRHHFHLGPKTHGSDNYRQPGSIGSMYPQRVIKGRRMAGHLGHTKNTVKNLIIFNIDPENNILYLRGAVPGANKSTVCVWSENDQN